MSGFRNPTTDNRELNVVKECRNLYFLVRQKVSGRKDYYLWQHCLKSIISVGSNLAEGNKRTSYKDNLRFIDMAVGSMAEFEFQYSLLSIDDKAIDDKIDKIKAMSHKLKSAVRSRLTEVGQDGRV